MTDATLASARGRTTLDRDTLFDPQFLAAAQRLRLVARRVAPRGRFADQRSRDRGSGLEFQDYRPYVAGDDLRAIDWTVYRRLGRVFLRLFEEHEDLPLYLLPDVSTSAFHGEGSPRVVAGLRASLALAAVSLGQHDRVGVYPFSDELVPLVRPTSGKGRLLELAARMTTVQSGGATDLRRAMATFCGYGLREGLVVVVSDFFDPGGIDAITDAFRGLRHKLLFVQLVRQSDRDPVASVGETGASDGEWRIVDCETGASRNVTMTAELAQRYRAAYDKFCESLAAFARSRGAGLLALDVDRDVTSQVATLFENGRREV